MDDRFNTAAGWVLGAAIVALGASIASGMFFHADSGELPEGVEMVMPGDNIEMKVKLIQPIAMDEQLRFAVREGGRTVGSGVITKILK